jgi:hypothetical protein
MPLCSDVSQRMAESDVLSTQKAPKSLPEIELGTNRRKEDLGFLPYLPLVIQLRNQQIGLEGALKGTDTQPLCQRVCGSDTIRTHPGYRNIPLSTRRYNNRRYTSQVRSTTSTDSEPLSELEGSPEKAGLPPVGSLKSKFDRKSERIQNPRVIWS